NGKRAPACSALSLQHRSKGCERHVHIAWIRRDALLALTKNRVDAIKPIQRAATATGLPFVALRKRRIVKVITARSLQEIAASCRKIAQLWAGTGQQRLTQHRISLHDQRMLGDIGISGESANTNTAAVWQFFDLRERQTVDVDELRRPLDAHF